MHPQTLQQAENKHRKEVEGKKDEEEGGGRLPHLYLGVCSNAVSPRELQAHLAAGPIGSSMLC